MGLRQYRVHEVWIHQLRIVDGKLVPVFPNGYKPVLMSENHCFRTFGATEADGQTLIDWVVVHLNPPRGVRMGQARHRFFASMLLAKGVWVNGRHYVRCIRSASGMRTGSALFVRAAIEHDGKILDRDDVRYIVSYGAQVASPNRRPDGTLQNPNLPANAQVCNIAKAESRFGLAKSTTYPTGLHLIRDISYTLVEDPVHKISVRLFGHAEPQEINFKPTDGMGTMRPLLAIKVVRQLQRLRGVVIAPDEVLDYLEASIEEDGYINSVTQDSEFKHLWLTYMPSAFQVRCAGMKGMSVVYPHDELHGVQEDLVISKSQWKYDFAEGFTPELLVCHWQKPEKSKYVKLNYQFINALSLRRPQLVAMAQEALNLTLEKVLTDADAAKAFLGIISTGDDEEEREEVSTVARVLAANSDMLDDYYVQRKLTDLFEKHVREMGRGRIPIPGAYRYSVADPGLLFGKPTLKKGENFINGEVGTFAAFRSPLIHRSEVARIRTVSVPEWEKLGLFRDLFVQSGWEDTDLKAGGADKDGDKFLITASELVLSAVDNSPIMMNASDEGAVEEWSWKSITKMDMVTLGGNAVGRITNLASSLVDWANAEIERLYEAGFDPETDEYEPVPGKSLTDLLAKYQARHQRRYGDEVPLF